MIFKSHCCFANISTTKARIFLKFDTYIHKIVKKYHNIFFASFTRVCARIFTKNFMIFLYYLMNLSLKFHKDPSFRCRDICKTILTFENHQISMYFPWYDISLHQLLIKISLVLYIRHEWFSIQNDPWYTQKKIH